MNKIYRLSTINQNGEQFLVCTSTSYDGDGIGQRRMAAVPVEPGKAQGILAAARKNEIHVEFGAENRQNRGVYTGSVVKGPDPELELAAPATAAELVTK